MLTHWGRVMHICVSKLYHHWFKWWLVVCLATTHYLNHWWFIVNWTLSNIFQRNFMWNSKVFIQENAYENAIYKNGSHLVSASMFDGGPLYETCMWWNWQFLIRIYGWMVCVLFDVMLSIMRSFHKGKESMRILLMTSACKNWPEWCRQ